VGSATARNAGALFESMFVQMILQPLAREESVLGSYGTACIAQSVAREDAHGFGSLLATMLERSHG